MDYCVHFRLESSIEKNYRHTKYAAQSAPQSVRRILYVKQCIRRTVRIVHSTLCSIHTILDAVQHYPLHNAPLTARVVRRTSYVVRRTIHDVTRILYTAAYPAVGLDV